MGREGAEKVNSGARRDNDSGKGCEYPVEQ